MMRKKAIQDLFPKLPDGLRSDFLTVPEPPLDGLITWRRGDHFGHCVATIHNHRVEIASYFPFIGNIKGILLIDQREVAPIRFDWPLGARLRRLRPLGMKLRWDWQTRLIGTPKQCLSIYNYTHNNAGQMRLPSGRSAVLEARITRPIIKSGEETCAQIYPVWRDSDISSGVLLQLWISPQVEVIDAIHLASLLMLARTPQATGVHM